MLVQDVAAIVRTRLIPSLGMILVALAAGSALVGMTISAFSAPTSNEGSSFETASSFGGSCGTAPTPVWINGMEHGSTQTPDVFSSNIAGSYDGTVAHTGAGSLKVNKSASIGYIRKQTFGNAHVLHFAFRLAALPSGDVTLAALDSFGTDLLFRYQASTQKLALQWGAEAPVVASSSVVPATWYSIDVRASTAASPLTASWRIDGIDQPDASSSAAATAHSQIYFGTTLVSETPTYVANFDDIVHSRTLGDYPIGEARVRALHPNEVGTHNNAAAFRNNDDSAIDASSWMRIDDASVFGGTDWVKQVAADTSGYLEFGFENTSETCIQGVQAYASMGSLSSQGNTMKSSVFDGSTERVVYSGGSPCGACTQPKNALITPAASAWTQSAVNGLVMRNGYASAASPQPFWGVLMLEYAAK